MFSEGPFSPFKRSIRSPSPGPKILVTSRPKSVHRGIDVPNELWIHITRFLSDEEVYTLIGVNSVFLDVGLRCKWGEVEVDMENISTAIYRLSRLSDPFVAGYVKRLTLRLQQFKKQRTPAEDNGFRKRLAHRLGLHTKPPPNTIPAVEDAVKKLISIIPHLTRVCELHIDLWEFPTTLLPPVFLSVSSCFGERLRVLYIGGDTDSYRFLLNDCKLKFDNLQEIHFELTNRAFKMEPSDADSKTLKDVVAVFVETLAPTLEVFRIWCWATVDVSGFYQYLKQVKFKKLTTIRIGTAFDKMSRDPTTLKDFITHNSSTLTRLELRLTPNRVQLDPTAEVPLGVWLDDLVDDNLHFPNLQTLEIYPTNTLNGHKALLTLIERVSPTLLDLVVRDRYFTSPQAKQLIEATSQSRLRFFRMNAVQLDLELLDLIAKNQQCLERLWLSVSKTIAADGSTFCQELKTRDYDHWNLKDVHIWQGGQEMEVETLIELARAAPSIQKFFGSPITDVLITKQVPKVVIDSDLVEFW